MVIREQTAEDVEQVQRIRRLAFGRIDENRPRAKPGTRVLVAEVAGRLAGVLGIGEYAQFFGGRAVAMGGVGGVAVDPYARGRGVASGLLDAALSTMREHGQHLSVLYPTVPELYRARGYESAGVFEWTTLPMDRLLAVPDPDRRIAARAPDEDDLPGIRDCYLGLARTVNGMLDRRPPRIGVASVLEMDTVSVLPGEAGAIRGYLSAQRQADGGLKVFDMIGADRDAQLTLLTELKSWVGIIERMELRITDPGLLSFLTSQQKRHDVRRSTWMLRVVDLTAAIAERGWTTRLRNSAADVDIIDDAAPWHAGKRRIIVEDGVVRCEPGGTGAVRLTARALGPWFSGMHDTHTLRRAGLIEGDPADAALLDELTATPGVPRLADSF